MSNTGYCAFSGFQPYKILDHSIYIFRCKKNFAQPYKRPLCSNVKDVDQLISLRVENKNTTPPPHKMPITQDRKLFDQTER